MTQAKAKLVGRVRQIVEDEAVRRGKKFARSGTGYIYWSDGARSRICVTGDAVALEDICGPAKIPKEYDGRRRLTNWVIGPDYEGVYVSGFRRQSLSDFNLGPDLNKTVCFRVTGDGTKFVTLRIDPNSFVSVKGEYNVKTLDGDTYTLAPQADTGYEELFEAMKELASVVRPETITVSDKLSFGSPREEAVAEDYRGVDVKRITDWSFQYDHAKQKFRLHGMVFGPEFGSARCICTDDIVPETLRDVRGSDGVLPQVQTCDGTVYRLGYPDSEFVSKILAREQEDWLEQYAWIVMLFCSELLENESMYSLCS